MYHNTDDLRIRSQLPLERKTSLAHFVVWNDGSLTNLENQASELAKILRKPLS